jgi:polysaccharide biosynthesis transport protein
LIGAQSNLQIPGTEQSQYSMPFPLAEEEEAGGGLTLLQLWHMLRAYLWFSVGLFVVMVGLAFMVIKLLPKSYEATTALIVNSELTDPLAGRNQPLGLTFTFFPTQVELINNSVVLRPVVNRLKLQADPQFTGGFVGDPKTLSDVVLENLRASLHVQPGTNSQLLYISAMARDPGQAADIANAVADEYLRQISQRTNAPAIERATRYSEQLAELKNKVDATQARVDEFRQTHGMADLKEGQNGDSEGAALSDLEAKLLQAKNERRQLEVLQVTPEAVALRGRLDQLEGELGEARATLGPQHPRMLQLQSEIDATRKSLSGNTSSQLARARELEDRYQAAVREERSRLLVRRGVQDEGAKLLLEQQLARDAYAQALRGQDTVQFASVGNYKDVMVVSRAEPPVKSTKPNKLKLFLAAIAASLALAVGGPFAYELLLNRRIRCRDDLERHFRIVTLAQFERMNPAPAA